MLCAGVLMYRQSGCDPPKALSGWQRAKASAAGRSDGHSQKAGGRLRGSARDTARYLSRLRTTLLTLRRFRSTYVWPTPQNMIGAPEVYTMDSAAPTCAQRMNG